MQDIDLTGIGDNFVEHILDTVETPIAILDGDGAILRFNHACEALTGYTEGEAIGRRVWDFLIVDEEIEAVRQVFAKTYSQDLPTHYTNYWKTKTGRRRLLKWSNKTLRKPNGEIGIVLATAVDITEITSAKHELHRSQATLSAIVESAPISIITSDEAGTILTFSRQAEETFGYQRSEILGKNVNVLMCGSDRDDHARYLDGMRAAKNQNVIGHTRTIRALRANGETFTAQITLEIIKTEQRMFAAFIRDMSKREEIESRLAETQYQLQHAGRLGAMGEIATSIAHELNQPLTAAASLVGAVSLRLKKGECPECKDSLPLLDDAVSEVRRASEIIHQMREFVRKRKTAKSLHDVNKIIEDAAALAVIGGRRGRH